jgi:hypothetical protein
MNNKLKIPISILVEMGELDDNTELRRIEIKRIMLDLKNKKNNNKLSQNTEDQRQKKPLSYMYPVPTDVKNRLYKGKVVVK